MAHGAASIDEYSGFPTSAPGEYTAVVEIVDPATDPAVVSNTETYRVVIPFIVNGAEIDLTPESSEGSIEVGGAVSS